MKYSNFLLANCLICISVFIMDCNKRTSYTKATDSKKIEIPFPGKEYQPDKNHFRVTNSGRSMNLPTAKKIAMTNARAELASNIEIMVKSVTDQYTNQRDINEKQEWNEKFENLTRTVVKQELLDSRLIGQEVYQSESDKQYTFWVAVEMEKDALLKGLNNSIQNDAKLRQDYDKKKFEEIFNKEMENLKNEQGG